MAAAWEKLRGHAGLEFREYEEGRVWRFRQMVAGKAQTDNLGLMTEEEAAVIAAKLRHNRKIGAGPQTYKDMEAEALEVGRAERIEEEKERKRIIAEDEFTKSNTIDTFWTNVYWPKRKEKGSAHGNKSMEGVYRLWIKPVVGDVSLMDFTYLDVERMFKRMREPDQERTRCKDGTSAKTQLHAYTILQGIWNEARKYHSATRKLELPIFPGKLTDKAALNNEKTCWLEMGEAKKLLKALKNWRECCMKNGIICKGPDSENAYGMAVLSLFSGLRFGDISKLTWGEVTDKEMAYARDPKGGKSYGIHLDIEIIRKMLAERRSKLNMTPKPNDLVFVNIRGKRYESVPQIFDDVVYDLQFNFTPRRWDNKMEKIDFHSLRHTFASWLAMRGESLYAIMELMGHKSLKMTQRYARLDPSKTKQSVEAMYIDFNMLGNQIDQDENTENKD